MSDDAVVDHSLVSLVVCPDCNGELELVGEGLQCKSCRRKYAVKAGIPMLYPASMDADHLHEEESLAQMMKRVPSDTKDRFSATQWDNSKKEFWGMVKNIARGEAKNYLNVGCGYDPNYMEFEQRGNVFVNFDLVYDMLLTLKERHGARCCVAGDINRLPFKKASIDYVISIDVIHHESQNLEPLIRSFSELLRPGGTLFLEDPNAWGLFQAHKSILLPRPIYQRLRNAYHRLKKSSHRPADYEFPTNVWQVKKILKNLGFTDIAVHPNTSYPSIGPQAFWFYKIVSGVEHIKKYHNYHYMISAVKSW